MISNILLITFSQGIIISLFLLANRNIRRSRYAYLLLMAFFLSLSIMQAWLHVKNIRLPGIWQYVFAPWFFFLMPFMFMYVESLVSVPRLSKKFLVLAFFLFTFNVMVTMYVARHYAQEIEYLKSFLWEWIHANEVIGLAFSWGLLFLIYFYYKRNQKLFHPYLQRWITRSFYFANAIFLLWGLVIYGKYTGRFPEKNVHYINEALHLSSSFIVYWIIYAGIFHRMILDYNDTNLWDNTKEIHLLNLIEHYEWYKDPHANLKKIAERLRISPSRLHKMVQRHYHSKFDEYLTDLRLEEAKRLMSQYPKVTVDEIALMCGYTDAESFREAFKNSYGIEPEMFMQNMHASLS